MWGDKYRLWDIAQLIRIIKRETGKRLRWPIIILDYYHIVVGIGWIAVGEGFGRRYKDKVREVEEAEIEEGKDILEL